MKRPLFISIALLCVLAQAAGADVMYDPGLPGVWGLVLREGSNAEAMVQPFAVRMSGWADRIGVGVGVGADPNHVGFKVTLTQTELVTLIPGTPIAGSWSIHPAGAAMAYAYIDIEPVLLSADEVYALIIEPGDPAMYGGVAYTYVGGPGWRTSDDWETAVRLPYPAAIRVYGTPVPEPGSLSAVMLALAGIGVSTRRRT